MYIIGKQHEADKNMIKEYQKGKSLPNAILYFTSISFLVLITDFVMIQKFSMPIRMTTYGKICLQHKNN